MKNPVSREKVKEEMESMLDHWELTKEMPDDEDQGRGRKIMREIVVDNFAGGGGASTGIEIAMGRSVDVAINHDPAAIAMHRTNHPGTKHYTEDVWKVDPVEACDGHPVALAWFSPDCKHFSKAKGGKPVSKKIRGLAWVAVKWAKAVHPRVIMLENVEEFQEWGRLDKNNRPDPAHKGETFQRFINQLKKLGYDVEYRTLRACDYGAPTIRKRFFLIARCDGCPIIWPEPTHADPESDEVANGQKERWKPVADVLKFDLPCPSIFDSTEEIWEKHHVRAVRPLADATMRRIARGIQKFVIENPQPFIVQVNHSGDGFRGQEIDEPLDTITAKHGTGIVEPIIVSIGQNGFAGDRRQHGVDEPLRTIVSKAEHCLVEPLIAPVEVRNNNGSSGNNVKEPLRTITTGGHHMLAAANLIQYHGEKSEKEVRGQDASEPLKTADGSNRYGLVSTFISKYYSGDSVASGSDKPLPTVTAFDHNALCAVTITQFNHYSIGQEVTKPLNTLTAQTNHFGEVCAFLVKYYGNGENAVPCDEPAPTITAKDRLGLVTVHGQDYQIVDIGLRMLTPRELFNAQGFPEDYIIDVDADGKAYPKSEQVARCGNAVCPPIPTALVRANLPELCKEAG